MADLAASRMPSVLTPPQQEQYRYLPPPIIQSTAQAMARVQSLVYIASDPPPAKLALAEPIARIAYYKGETGQGNAFHFRFWLTESGQVAHFSFYQR